MTLTVALTILGVLVIVAVVAHGQWQSRKAGAKRLGGSRRVGGDSGRDSRLEPGLDDGREAPVEPSLDHLDGASPLPARAARTRAQNRLDALIDAIVPLRLEAPISGELALAHLPTTRRAGSKPFQIELLDPVTGEWDAPVAGQQYAECQAGVQLANRGGALNEIEYSEFVQKVERFAEGVGAVPEFPDMLDVVGRARELDGFASAHDAQLAVQLRASGAAWSVGYLEQQAGRFGFVPGAVPGRLVQPAAEEGAPPVLTIAYDPQAALAEDPNQATLRSVTLAYDVPQTDPAVDAFDAWRDAAHKVAVAIEAEVVDDAGRPLPVAGFEQIGRELEQLHAALQRRDLPAGSAAARRLFS